MVPIRMKRIALLLLVVLLTGCSGATEMPSPTPSPSASVTPVSPFSPLPTLEAPSALPSPTSSPLAVPPNPPGKTLTPPAERARVELATRLGIDPASIELVSVTRQEMPFQFLGCPPEGATPRADMPAMVFGQEIILRHDGTEYVYHAHLVQLFYCGER